MEPINMAEVRKVPSCILALAICQTMVACWQATALSAEFVPLPDTAQQPPSPTVRQLEVPAFSPVSENQQGLIRADYTESFRRPNCSRTVWQLEACVRGYYLNDQRIKWSGVEATFGAEAALAPRVEHTFDDWKTCVESEFYLNQPFDRNILVDTAERASYRANFDIPAFEISQLYVSAGRGNCTFSVGKFETPFGRTYFPLYTNARLDAPFIRTECILWRETGAMVHYQREVLVADVAITNGGEDQDANSSKALVSRLGADTDLWACGFSVKVHDGIGSEGQKQFNNHLGLDSMVRLDRFTLSGEAIYDEYGFRRPGFDPLDITWGRSIYLRDQNYGLHTPVTGYGYYLDLMYGMGPFTISCNYGEYYPQQLGIPQHDVTQRRSIIKGAFAATSHLQFYLGCLLENGGYPAQDDRPRTGWVALAGMQWTR